MIRELDPVRARVAALSPGAVAGGLRTHAQRESLEESLSCPIEERHGYFFAPGFGTDLRMFVMTSSAVTPSAIASKLRTTR